ncbi:disulfide bond formation protein B [Actibacterium lipolyticum]|uniref:Disulfide bond formation protein B n=1 Tax=Actibacterium lipolyticum TaxID=1524263 RepID=A0A238JWD9_9RHOB|nr:disulfide bond formation protein B [Actibacterium lipolyticum]SMX34988.1 Disulfide bond formation protein B [Actibacterium lipolyticum]
MTRKQLVVLASGGSLALLLGAFAFQFIGGVAPCKMCLWQRWPHLAAILLGPLAWFTRTIWFPIAGLLAAATTSGIGIYHTGVERKWWEGPTSCSGSGNALSGLSGADLLNFDAAPTVVMCDVVAWADPVLNLSMASWNAVLSAILALIWLAAAVSSRD